MTSRSDHWIRQYAGGDLIAASTLQPGMQWFETSFGVWAYAAVDGFDVTLGGPLCDPSDRSEMIRRFLARSRKPILNWPMRYTDPGPRRIYALEKFDREHQGMFGFAALNPIYDGGQHTGYLLDILRFEPTKLWGVWLSTVHALARDLGQRGEQLSLGFAPLHRVRRAPRAGSRTLQAQFDWMARGFANTQYVRRLRELKDAIPGPEEQRYVASYTRSAPTVFYAFARAMKVPFRLRLLEAIGQGMRTQIR